MNLDVCPCGVAVAPTGGTVSCVGLKTKVEVDAVKAAWGRLVGDPLFGKSLGASVHLAIAPEVSIETRRRQGAARAFALGGGLPAVTVLTPPPPPTHTHKHLP